jgi:glycosyltransferase involved in cell wall biosynthesis
MTEKMKNKIVLDLRGSQDGYKEHLKRGIGRYVAELSVRLPLLMPDAKFYYLYDKRYEQGNVPVPVGVEEIFAKPTIPLWGPQEILRAQLAVRPLLRKIKPDITLFFSHEDTILYWQHAAVFVHDLIPYHFSDLYEINRDLKTKIRTRLMVLGARQADLIFTISECSKKDIMRFWDVPSGKIEVVSAAIDTKLFYRRDQTEIAQIRLKYNIPENYLLYVGGFDPRKNVSGMLKALSIARSKQSTIHLIIAGQLDGQMGYDQTMKLLRTLDLESNITFIGFVPNEDLPFIYSGSKGLVFPSLYEGFGLPILEALSCGVPVAAARNSAIPEAAGETAYYCDVENPDDLSRAMLEFGQNELLTKKALVEGPKRAALFSWDAVAAKVTSRLSRYLQENK